MKMMEYSKCPLKKRPIFVIKEEESQIEEEDGPIDLTTKKPGLNYKKNFKDLDSRFEVPLNFSHRLEAIKEENYETVSFSEMEITPQDLSYRNFNISDKINLSRNFNNNLIDNQNYSKTLRTSPVSPSNFGYTDNEFMEINEIPNQPVDLTVRFEIKPKILATRNQNVIVEPNKETIFNSSYNQPDSYYRCNTCTKCYSTYSGLLKHQQTHITNNEQNYINVIENTEEINTFITSSNNNNSNISVKNENSNLQIRVANIHRYQCKDCGKSYSTCSGLTKHQQFHCPNAEGNQVKKVFSCKNCDKVYVSLGALKMHIRTHTLPCKCPECGKAFSRPWLLQGHIRTHTGEKPFSCQHCNRAFADRSNLRAHLQTHSDVKKYSCSSCTKTFSRMSLLGKHLQSGCPGILKSNSPTESMDENSSNLYQNNNDYSENVSSNNCIDSAGYVEQHQINKHLFNTGNIQFANSVIKGPIKFENPHEIYQPGFGNY